MKRTYLFGIWNKFLGSFVLLNHDVRFGCKTRHAMEQTTTWQKASTSYGSFNYEIKRFEANANEKAAA